MNCSIIIGSHPDSKQKEHVLLECVNSIKKTKFAQSPFILATHVLPSKSFDFDYIIYDKKNISPEREFSLECLNINSSHYFHHFEGGIYKSVLNLFHETFDHHYSAFLNMYNGALISKQKGYDNFLYVEGDSIFDEEELNKFYDICEQNNNVFFYSDGIWAYSTLCFYVNIESFLSKVGHLCEIEEWKKYCILINNQTVEKIFFTLYQNNDDFIIHQTTNNLSDFFTRSSMNHFSAPSKNYLLSNICKCKNSGEIYYVYNSEIDAHTIFNIRNENEEIIVSINSDSKYYVCWQVLNKEVFIYCQELHFQNIIQTSEENIVQSFSLSQEKFNKYLELNTIEFF